MIRKDEGMWESIKDYMMSHEIAGTRAGQWSARKAQVAVRVYKELGGEYVGPKSRSNSLVEWTEQDWTTKSGRPSSETGERYLPRKVIEGLTPKEYAATTRAKRRGSTQYVPQPESVKEKVRAILSRDD